VATEPLSRFPRPSWEGARGRERLLPLWEPRGVSGYRGQVRFFRRQYPNAEVRVQRGTQEDRWPPLGGTAAPAPGVPPAQQVARVIVTEQGYLRGGLKRRRDRTLILKPGVKLCAA